MHYVIKTQEESPALFRVVLDSNDAHPSQLPDETLDMEYSQYESPAYTVAKISGQAYDGPYVNHNLPHPITWSQFSGSDTQTVILEPKTDVQQRQVLKHVEYHPREWYNKYIYASVLSILCCCPLGVAAMMRSCFARTAADEKRPVEAKNHLKEAALLIPLAIICGIVILVVVLAVRFAKPDLFE